MAKKSGAIYGKALPQLLTEILLPLKMIYMVELRGEVRRVVPRLAGSFWKERTVTGFLTLESNSCG